jgi:hypothetical protein
MSAPNLAAPVLCKVSDFGMSRRLAPSTNLYRREVMNPYWLAPVRNFLIWKEVLIF